MLRSDNIIKDEYYADENGNIYHLKLTQLTPHIDTQGYYCVKIKDKLIRVGRFVAQQFLDNPDNLPEVDHIDRDKTNNKVSNLRWVSRSDNCRNKSNNKKVIDLNTGIIYDSLVACAEALNTSRFNVFSCLKANCLCKGHKLERI